MISIVTDKHSDNMGMRLRLRLYTKDMSTDITERVQRTARDKERAGTSYFRLRSTFVEEKAMLNKSR